MTYAALITAWNGATQPPTGVTGTALTGGMTTAQKVAAVNAWTVPAAQPAILNVTSVLNAIASADFLALTATQIAQMQLLLMSGANGTVNASPGTTVRAVFQSIFAGKTTTLANLSALVSPYDNATELWVTANGYGTGINTNDAAAAGLV